MRDFCCDSVATNATRRVWGDRLFLVIPLGFNPKTFRTFSDLIQLNEKREKPFVGTPFPRDPVGIQTQDRQNFF